MTVQGFKKATTDLTKVEKITLTSVQSIFPSRWTDGSFVVNDAEETFEFKDNGMHYTVDINDVDMIVQFDEVKEHHPSYYPA